MATCFNDSFIDSEPLLTVKLDELDEPSLEISENLVDYEQIASYNWLGTPKKPIVVVPGAPKKFTAWDFGRLDQDAGDLVADENHIMCPNFPMEPMFQAVKLCTEDDSSVKFQDVDIATDRNNLRKLFSIFNATVGNKMLNDECLMYVQRIGRLICLIRCQFKDKECANERRNPTFGRSFELKCTESVNTLTCGSFRQIVSYKFGNLKFMVRFEVDCAEYKKSSLAKQAVDNVNATPGVDDLNELMGKLSVSTKLSDEERLPGSDLHLIRYGQKSNFHLVELTTRFYTNYRPKDFPTHVWPQMFFSGTQTLVLGYQHKGMVKPGDVQTFDVKSVLTRHGPFPKKQLKRMHNFLSKVVDFVRDKDQDRIFAILWVSGSPDVIKVFDVEDVDRFAVPDGLKRFVEQN